MYPWTYGTTWSGGHVKMAEESPGRNGWRPDGVAALRTARPPRGRPGQRLRPGPPLRGGDGHGLAGAAPEDLRRARPPLRRRPDRGRQRRRAPPRRVPDHRDGTG